MLCAFHVHLHQVESGLVCHVGVDGCGFDGADAIEVVIAAHVVAEDIGFKGGLTLVEVEDSDLIGEGCSVDGNEGVGAEQVSEYFHVGG